MEIEVRAEWTDVGGHGGDSGSGEILTIPWVMSQLSMGSNSALGPFTFG